MKIEKFWDKELPDIRLALIECANDFTHSTLPVKFKQLWQPYLLTFTEAYGKFLFAKNKDLYWFKIFSNVIQKEVSFSGIDIEQKILEHCVDYLKFHLIAMYCVYVYQRKPNTYYFAWYHDFIDAEGKHLNTRIIRKLNELQWSLLSTKDMLANMENLKNAELAKIILVTDPDLMFTPLLEQRSFLLDPKNSKEIVVCSSNNKPLWSVHAHDAPEKFGITKSHTHHTVIAQKNFVHNEVLAVLEPTIYSYDPKETVVTDHVYHELPMLVRRWSFFYNSQRTGSAYVSHHYRADVTADSKIVDEVGMKSSLLFLANESHYFGHKHKPLQRYNAKLSSAGVVYVTDPNGIKKGEEIVIHRRTQLAWNCTEDAMRKYIYRFCDNNGPINDNFFLLNAIMQRKECRSDVNFNVSSIGNINCKNTFFCPISVTLDGTFLYDTFIANIDKQLEAVPQKTMLVKKAVLYPFIEFVIDNVESVTDKIKEWKTIAEDSEGIVGYLKDQQKIYNQLYDLLPKFDLSQHTSPSELDKVIWIRHGNRVMYVLDNNKKIQFANAETNNVSICNWEDIECGPFFMMEGFDLFPMYLFQKIKNGQKILDPNAIQNFVENYETDKHRNPTAAKKNCEVDLLKLNNIDGDFFDVPIECEFSSDHQVIRRSSFFRKINNLILYQLILDK